MGDAFIDTCNELGLAPYTTYQNVNQPAVHEAQDSALYLRRARDKRLEFALTRVLYRRKTFLGDPPVAVVAPASIPAFIFSVAILTASRLATAPPAASFNIRSAITC